MRRWLDEIDREFFGFMGYGDDKPATPKDDGLGCVRGFAAAFKYTAVVVLTAWVIYELVKVAKL